MTDADRLVDPNVALEMEDCYALAVVAYPLARRLIEAEKKLSERDELLRDALPHIGRFSTTPQAYDGKKTLLARIAAALKETTP